ncbi:C39 family peptidase [Fimbriiglobus ruber]|uniref:Peptidase C39-like domain-containing protein n=1 Tax=Fimbriiglobus ruber TaxID=1908690 RepID=A0A225CYV0_9BACT|nr:C39 family peptidase [Fimbriiglobus ruber]OWK34422.1 hypothetical protein FRUB_10393 [Fimbriiglobus ruber]
MNVLRTEILFLVSMFCVVIVQAGVPAADKKQPPAELLERAQSGKAEAQRLLGLLYRDGKSVEQDYKEALRWSRSAADQGNGLALDDLGYLYFLGWGVPQDYDIAKGYFKSAGRAGNPRGYFNLGECYFSGLGGEQNYERAVEYWKKAAEAGSGEAALALAMLYASGDGAPRDANEALRWCEMALKTTPTEALIFLGELQFQMGEDEKAVASWEKAAQKNSQQAKDLLRLKEWRRRKPEAGQFAYVAIPHIHQGYNNCGATSATMVLQFQGTKAGPYDVKRLCSSPIGTGSDWSELIAAAGKFQQRWELVTFSDDDPGFRQGTELLRRQLDSGRPVVIDFTVPSSSRPGEFAGHTVVAVGYVAANDWFILRDPAPKSPGLRILSTAELKKLWRSGGYTATARQVARPAIVIAKD